MNKRVSTFLSALLLATTLGWQQPLANVTAAAATHAQTEKTVKAGKHAKAKTHGKTSKVKATKKGKTSKKTTTAGQHIKLQGASNARDLGGYVNKNGQKIKAHRLIRSNSLSNLSKSDMKKLVKTYHVQTDIDLRTTGEQQKSPDKQIKGVHLIKDSVFLSFPPFPDFTKKNAGVKMMEKSYHDAVTTKQGRKAYKTLFQALLKNPNNKSVLWHCSACKDRAGMGTVFVLSALNFDKKTIAKDYLKSNTYLAKENAQKLTAAKAKTSDANVLANTKAMNDVRMSYLNTTYKAINHKYGSMKNFLHKGLGLSNHQLAQLQKSYLTPAKTK